MNVVWKSGVETGKNTDVIHLVNLAIDHIILVSLVARDHRVHVAAVTASISDHPRDLIRILKILQESGLASAFISTDQYVDRFSWHISNLIYCDA